MSIIEDADILTVKGRGKFCTLWLDEYPESPVHRKISVDGVVFDLVHVHYNFGANPVKKYLGIDVSDFDIADDWFVGKEVLPAD